MPRKTKTTAGAAETPVLEVPAELLDQLVKGPMTQGDLETMFRSLKKAVIERAMGAEMNQHLGYKAGEARPAGQSNHRNGSSAKTVLTDEGAVRIEVPRDREGSYEPQIVGKHERRFSGFDQKIVAMYARGMTVREIQGYLAEMYGTEVSPEFISQVTEEVMAEVIAWQNRPLEALYPVVFFDALRIKIRDESVVRNKAVYLALGVLPDGSRDVLGIWIEQTEGAKFWLKVFNDLKTRGCNDILIAVVDGLKGLAEAIETAYPATTVQTCIVHLIRNSLDYTSYRDRRVVAGALRPIYTAVSASAAEAALSVFEASDWSAKYPTIAQSWRRAWEHVIPFFAFPPEVRRVIYTTNVIESLHMQLRKIIKNRGHFPSDEAATKLLWLALRNVMAKQISSTREWKSAMTQFAILYGDRFTPSHS
ncbi:MAG: IS256 family transposase [Burkholderiales bacterium]|nr:IS256 family transposase [Burkholderiales bacterium]